MLHCSCFRTKPFVCSEFVRKDKRNFFIVASIVILKKREINYFYNLNFKLMRHYILNEQGEFFGGCIVVRNFLIKNTHLRKLGVIKFI
jgi:hypothetical protein